MRSNPIPPDRPDDTARATGNLTNPETDTTTAEMTTGKIQMYGQQSSVIMSP
jgi:hypothetical protein